MNNIKNLMLITIIILILILANNVIAVDEILSVDESPFYFDQLGIKLNISGHINISGSLNSIHKLTAILGHYPRDDENVKIRYFNPYPEYELANNSLIYYFRNEQIKQQMTYNLYSELIITPNKPIIKTDPKFPITSIPSEYNKYIQETINIDLTREVKNKATLLVRNTDGIYEATFNIASWVYENIEYIEDEETEDTVQKSSWTLENQKGVCDEITSLFIAMVRSVGVPARFVSGLAYSNIDKEFGNHAWAEVYFHKQGWIPFDVTYGEFGWVDSSHIVLSRSVDSKTVSLECSALGTNAQIYPSNLNFDAIVLETGDHKFSDIDIEVNVLSQEIDFGYNIIETEITNKEEGYLAQEIVLTKVQDLIIKKNNKKFILLEPDVPKKVRWVVKVNDTLNKNAHYRFPADITTRENNSARIYFNVSNQGILYSENYVNNFIESFNENAINDYAADISIICEVDEIYILNRQNRLKCEISNTGEKNIDNLNACFFKECKTIKIGPKTTETVTFNPIFKVIGLQTHIATLSNTNLKKSEYLNFNVKDQPQITVRITNPNEIEFKERFFVQTNITVDSNSRPKKLNISFYGSGMSKDWYFRSMNIDQVINLRMKGDQLYKGNNKFYFDIKWENELGEKFEERREVEVNLTNLNLWQSFYAWVNKITG